MPHHLQQLLRPQASTLIALRLEEAAVQYEIGALEDVIRYVIGSLQRTVIIGDVIRGRHGQQDQIRRVLPDLVLQREQLLARAIASFAEVQDLDRGTTESRKATLEHLSSGLFKGDLER